MEIKRKAYMRTLEMIMAAFITFVFVSYVVPRAPTVPEEQKIPVLSVLSQDIDFKNCVVQDDFDCIERMIDSVIPEQYELVYDISESPFIIRTNLPKKRVFSDAFFFAGNGAVYKPVMIRVYYWRKEE